MAWVAACSTALGEGGDSKVEGMGIRNGGWVYSGVKGGPKERPVCVFVIVYFAWCGDCRVEVDFEHYGIVIV